MQVGYSAKSPSSSSAFDNDPKYQRFFYRVADGEVSYLDRTITASWRHWAVGHVLHWHPYKVTLLRTKRAGLHIVSNWRAQDGDMRYGSNVGIASEGIFVLSPGQVVEPAMEVDAALRNPFERDLICTVLQQRFQMDFGVTAYLGNVLANVPAETSNGVSRGVHHNN